MPTAGDTEVSSNWLMGRRLPHGNGGKEARGWHLVGMKQRIPRRNLVMLTSYDADVGDDDQLSLEIGV
jgi:hypothetical protein